MKTSKLRELPYRHPYLFALVLLVVALAVNFYLQPNLFELRVLSGNLRIFLPLMILAAGQTIVIIGGGIDLSVGTMVSMVNAILVRGLPETRPPPKLSPPLAWALAQGWRPACSMGLVSLTCACSRS